MIEVIKKYAGYVIAFLLLLLIAKNCINSTANKYIGEGNVYEEQLENRVKILKQDSIKAFKTVDSLHQYNKKKDSIISGLKKKNTDLEKKIIVVKKDKDKAVDKSKSFTYKQSADYIAAKYKKPEAVSYDSTGVKLEKDIPNQVVKTIIEKDACEQEAFLSKEILANSESEKKILEEKVINKDKEVKAISDYSKSQNYTLEASQAANESYKKQNKTLRTVRTIDRTIIIVGIIAGLFILK